MTRRKPVFLKSPVAITGVFPDVVCSGHVHNYQRFSKHYPDGETVRYLVSGAGGYADLHKIVAAGDERVFEDAKRFKKVQLDNYCDHSHGFLKMRVERSPEGLSLAGEYYTVNTLPAKEGAQSELFERFLFPLRTIHVS